MEKKGQQEIDFKAAENLRDRGMKRAVQHADNVFTDWSERALAFLKKYMQNNREFMVEQVREASQGEVPEPPSNRAWGAIVIRARKLGLIKRKGYGITKNKKAHCTPATIWEAVC